MRGFLIVFMGLALIACGGGGSGIAEQPGPQDSPDLPELEARWAPPEPPAAQAVGRELTSVTLFADGFILIADAVPEGDSYVRPRMGHRYHPRPATDCPPQTNHRER